MSEKSGSYVRYGKSRTRKSNWSRWFMREPMKKHPT